MFEQQTKEEKQSIFDLQMDYEEMIEIPDGYAG